jgi:hypothetical protein
VVLSQASTFNAEGGGGAEEWTIFRNSGESEDSHI